MLSRLMNFFFPQRCACQNRDQLGRALRANLVAHRRLEEAADGLVRASSDRVQRIEASRVEIRQRTADTSLSRSSPPTSDTRAQVDALMKRMAQERDAT